MQFNLSTTVGTDAPINSSVTFEDQFAPDFLAWAAEQYFPLGVLVTAAEGSVDAVYRAPTDQELLDTAWQGIATGMANHITDYRQRKAVAAALASVSGVGVVSIERL
jgi:hypothetical protein